MFSLLAAAFLLSAPEALTVRLRLPAGAVRPATVRVAFFDGESRPMSENQGTIDGNALLIRPPENAEWMQMVGPLFTRPTRLGPAGSSIEVNPMGTLRVIVPAGNSPVRIVAVDAATPDPTRSWETLPMSVLRPVATAFETDLQRKTATATIRLPLGKFAVGLDAGVTVPPLVAEVEIQAEGVAEVRLSDEAGQDVTVLARERGTGIPLKGAVLVSARPGRAVERALSELLGQRAGKSGADGLLHFGRVSGIQPLELFIGAEGRRMGRLALPARFEGGTRTVDLPPNQSLLVKVTGLTLKRDDPRPEVSLSRCRIQRGHSSCLPASPQTKPLGANDSVRFPRVENGLYQVDVRMPGGASTREDFEIAGKADDPDEKTLDLQALAWVLRGTTRIKKGEPVAARVVAIESINGLGEGRAAETRSGADGSFEMTVFSAPVRSIALHAESDDPKATGYPHDIGVLSVEKTILEKLEVELDPTGIRIRILDARSGVPVADCFVALQFGGGSMASPKTDRDGRVDMYGLGEGRVLIGPRCRGYVAKSASADLLTGEVRELDIELDKAEDFGLTVQDIDGRPVPGARVAGAVGQSYLSDAWAFHVDTVDIGVADESGELWIDGNEWVGRPFYVIAAGRALAFGIFPAASQCTTRDSCRTTIRMEPLLPPSVVKVRARSGKARRNVDVYLSKGGIPVPSQLILAAMQANGLGMSWPAFARAPFDGSVFTFLPRGSYLLRTYFFGPSRKDSFVLKPLATVANPSAENIELVDPTDFPMKQ